MVSVRFVFFNQCSFTRTPSSCSRVLLPILIECLVEAWFYEFIMGYITHYIPSIPLSLLSTYLMCYALIDIFNAIYRNGCNVLPWHKFTITFLVGDLMQSLNEIVLNGPLLICFHLYLLGLQFHHYQTYISVSFHVLKFLTLSLLL